jgi:hypothetical protein
VAAGGRQRHKRTRNALRLTDAQEMEMQERPNLVLSVEQELGITAGLQDRVIQVRLTAIRPCF